MKLVNFASLDPAQKKRNIKGLGNVSSLDRAIWEEFEAAPNSVAEQSEEEFTRLSVPIESPLETEPQLPEGPTEKPLSRPMRLVQSFFSRAVLAVMGLSAHFADLKSALCSMPATLFRGRFRSSCGPIRATGFACASFMTALLIVD